MPPRPQVRCRLGDGGEGRWRLWLMLSLSLPRVYLESGSCHSPPQPIVRPQKTEVCNFSKSSAATSGAVGVLTYDVFKKGHKSATEKIAIMFSVPYDYNLYKNWVAVGIYELGRECNEDLYKEMYYKNQSSFKREEAKGSCISYSGGELEVLCTMSPMGRAIMKVELLDQFFFSQSKR